MSIVIDLATFIEAGGDPPSWDDYAHLLKAFGAIENAKRRQLVIDFADVVAGLNQRPKQP